MKHVGDIAISRRGFIAANADSPARRPDPPTPSAGVFFLSFIDPEMAAGHDEGVLCDICLPTGKEKAGNWGLRKQSTYNFHR